MSRAARTGQVVLVLISLMSTLIAVSVYFVEDPFPADAQLLIASFGAGMGALTFACAAFGLDGVQRWPWLALWVLPVFFVWHVVVLGTVVPDAVLAVVSAAALVASRPRARRGLGAEASSVPASR